MKEFPNYDESSTTWLGNNILIRHAIIGSIEFFAYRDSTDSYWTVMYDTDGDFDDWLACNTWEEIPTRIALTLL